MRRLSLTIAAAAAVLAAAPASAAVTLINGSFESGTAPGSFTTLNAGSGDLTGWTIDSGSVDYIGSYWQPSNGSRSLDMNGNSTGSISQVITGLTAGQSYRVTFDLAGNPDGPPPTKSLAVSVDGNVTDFTFPGGNTRASMNWISNSLLFTAAGTTATLRFASNDAGFYGPALDNVAVSSAVPELSTWGMMLIGFAGLGMAAARRRQALAA